MNWRLFGLLAFSLILSVGCQTRLSDEKTYTLDSADIKTLIVDGVPRERELKVTATADNPVSLYVYLEADKAEVEPKIDVDVASDKVLAHAKDSKDIELTATIPSSETAMIDVKTKTDGTTVTVKLSD